MASRRDLKKDIRYLYSELLTECVIISSVSENADMNKAEEINNKILHNCYSFILRAGKPDAKENKQLVKAYYKKLGTDMYNDILAIGDEINNINK